MNNSDGTLRHFRELTPEELTTIDGGRRTRTERRSDRESRRSERREQRSDRRDARQERREERGSTRNGGGKSGWSTLTQVFSFVVGNGRGGGQDEGRRTVATVQQALPDEAGGGFGFRLASIGRKLVGIPYNYGGESLSGADCSGGLDIAVRKMGYTGQRLTAHEQFDEWTEAIPASEAAPGDLRFMDHNGNGSMDHVQVLVDGGRLQFSGGPNDEGTPSSIVTTFGNPGPLTRSGSTVYHRRIRWGALEL